MAQIIELRPGIRKTEKQLANTYETLWKCLRSARLNLHQSSMAYECLSEMKRADGLKELVTALKMLEDDALAQSKKFTEKATKA